VNLQPDHAKHQRVYRATLARYHFRVATPADCDGIVALWPEHWEEANYHMRGIVPDEDRYRRWRQKVLDYGVNVIVLALRGDEIVGFLEYSLDHNFSVEPVAVMGTFYVQRPHRRSAVPMILLELAIAQMQADGACALHAPITSESLSSRALENTFKKYGFATIGTMMGRAL
jgi:L-amino acid N-acyltransferase YncA